MSPIILFLISWAAVAQKAILIFSFLLYTLTAWIIMIGAIHLKRITPFLWLVPMITFAPTVLPLFAFNLYIGWWQTIVAYSYVVVDISICLGITYAILQRERNS